MGIEEIKTKYLGDALSKADQAKYSRYLVVGEDMFGKMMRPAGGSYYRKYDDAVRAAKSLQGKNTHHVYVEGEYSNGQMEMKPVYEWRNSKKPTKDVADGVAEKYCMDKLLITSNGFANENGVFRRDNRKGLKTFSVKFLCKNPVTGKITPSGRSKKALNLEEAKKWAEREGKTYKNLYKIEVEEFKDSVDENDVAGAGAVRVGFSPRSNVEKRLSITRRGRAMTLPQYGKPSKVYVGKDGDSFSVFNGKGEKLNKNPFRTASEASNWARGNGWIIVMKGQADSVDMLCADRFTPPVNPVDKDVASKAKAAIAKAGREMGLTPRMGAWNRDHKMAHALAFATIAGEKVTVSIDYSVDDGSVSIQVTNGGKHLFFDTPAKFKAWADKNGGANGRKLDSDKRKK